MYTSFVYVYMLHFLIFSPYKNVHKSIFTINTLRAKNTKYDLVGGSKVKVT